MTRCKKTSASRKCGIGHMQLLTVDHSLARWLHRSSPNLHYIRWAPKKARTTYPTNKYRYIYIYRYKYITKMQRIPHMNQIVVIHGPRGASGQPPLVPPSSHSLGFAPAINYLLHKMLEIHFKTASNTGKTHMMLHSWATAPLDCPKRLLRIQVRTGCPFLKERKNRRSEA